MLLAPEARLRRAALALHALAEGDRERVLAKLDGADRQRIEPVLHELRDLGIPPVVSPVDVVPAAGDEPSAVDRVRALPADTVAPVLASLPPATVALLLRAVDGPWADAVLVALSGPRRRVILAHRECVPRPAARMADALCRAFESACREHVAVPADAVRQPGLKRWWRWMR